MKRLLGLGMLSAVLLAQDWPELRLHRVASGFRNPTDIAAPPDGSGRLVIVEQCGTIRLIRNGAVLDSPFLDFTRKVSCGGERGLLGIAFPPGFASKRYFYIDYTDPDGNTAISRIQVSTDPDRANADSEEVLLRIVQPYPNHNGGQIRFGPDGYLYIGMGDGGSGGDPQNNAQRTDTLLGKLLRIDVESGQTPYSVPLSNPFTGRTGYRQEIWAIGLRNPWRFSFDRETGDLWIGDVGQDRFEEIDFQPASSRGGENYGWRRMEGLQCYNPSSGCDQTGLTPPILDYGRSLGGSVTGGFVYRGQRFPALRGIYFYADYLSGRVWGVQRSGSSWVNREMLQNATGFSTFGQDEGGELYIATYSGDLFLLATGAPQVTAESIVNAASFTNGLVPGSLATIFGRGITSFNGTVQASAFPLPPELAGTSVAVNGVRVPLTAVANVNGREQINLQLPWELTGAGTALVQVTANEATSNAVSVTLTETQPEIFALTRAGDAITLWATGLGAVSAPQKTGAPAPVSPLAMTLGETGVSVAGSSAPVTYSGLAPGFAGLYQVNAMMPAGVPNAAEVVLSVGAAASRPSRIPQQ